MDATGQVLAGRSVTLKIEGTTTDVTHYSAVTGGTSTTGGLVTSAEGTIVDGSGNRRYIASGQRVSITIAGQTRLGQALSAAEVPQRSNLTKNLKADYGAVGDDSTDDSVAVRAAALSGLAVEVPPGIYRCNNVEFATSNTRFLSHGGAQFRKNANGPLFIANTTNLEFVNIDLLGESATYTGVGLEMRRSPDLKWRNGSIRFTQSYPVEWTVSDNGTREQFSNASIWADDANTPSFRFPLLDTQSTDKLLTGIFCSGRPLADFRGCQTVMVQGCDFGNMTFSTDSKKVTMTGCRIAPSGADTTVKGINHTIVGNTHSGRFVLDSFCSSCVVGPNITTAASVDNGPTDALRNTLIDRYGASGTFINNLRTSLGRENGQPGIIAPGSRGWSYTSQLQVANRGYIMRVAPSRDIAMTLIAFSVLTPATNDDPVAVAIFDATLATVLATSGAVTGKANVSGVRTVPLAYTLTAGTVYYASFTYGAVGGTAATLLGANFNSSSAGYLFGQSAATGLEFDASNTRHPPTAPWGSITAATSGCPVLALREV